MVDGYFLHIKGNIEEKFRQKDNWDLRVTRDEPAIRNAR
jgi:DNA polymerase-3 subunit alpha